MTQIAIEQLWRRDLSRLLSEWGEGQHILSQIESQDGNWLGRLAGSERVRWRLGASL